MRILALDWGSVRIGVAISDPGGTIAFPFEKFIDTKEALLEIKKIVDEKEVEGILIGLPKSLSGQSSQSSKSVEEFVAKLQELVSCPIQYFDERLSSVGAGKTLTDQGLSSAQQRGLVDNLAAQQMLQQYLDKKTINN